MKTRSSGSVRPDGGHEGSLQRSTNGVSRPIPMERPVLSARSAAPRATAFFLRPHGHPIFRCQAMLTSPFCAVGKELDRLPELSSCATRPAGLGKHRRAEQRRSRPVLAFYRTKHGHDLGRYPGEVIDRADRLLRRPREVPPIRPIHAQDICAKWRVAVVVLNVHMPFGCCALDMHNKAIRPG